MGRKRMDPKLLKQYPCRYLESFYRPRIGTYICPNSPSMPLQLKGCLSQTCDGLSYEDATGTYNALTNAGGYGVANGVTGPADFDTYRLLLWAPNNDYYADTPTPSITLDLLENVPTQNPAGFYTWEYLLSQLEGITAIDDGTWYWEVVGVKGAEEFRIQGFALFINGLRALSDAKMKPWDPTCPCKSGCTDIASIQMKFFILERGGTCDPEKAEEVIKWLKSQLKTCC